MSEWIMKEHFTVTDKTKISPLLLENMKEYFLKITDVVTDTGDVSISLTTKDNMVHEVNSWIDSDPNPCFMDQCQGLVDMMAQENEFDLVMEEYPFITGYWELFKDELTVPIAPLIDASLLETLSGGGGFYTYFALNSDLDLWEEDDLGALHAYGWKDGKLYNGRIQKRPLYGLPAQTDWRMPSFIVSAEKLDPLSWDKMEPFLEEMEGMYECGWGFYADIQLWETFELTFHTKEDLAKMIRVHNEVYKLMTDEVAENDEVDEVVENGEADGDVEDYIACSGAYNFYDDPYGRILFYNMDNPLDHLFDILSLD